MKRFPLSLFVLMLACGLAFGQPLKDFSNCTQSNCHITKTKFSTVHSPVEEGCTSCHETNAKEHPIANKKEFKLVESVPKLCEQCHDLEMNKKMTHSPAVEGQCLSCHNPHSTDTEMLLKEEGGALCTECHDSYTNNDFVHGPVAAGMCSGCHEPHSSDYASLLKRDGQEVCLFCHTAKKDVQSKASVHEPFVDGCMKCHTPHSSKAKYLLPIDVPELCYECHKTVEVSLGKKSEVHGPFQQGGKCYLCHNAHVSDYKPLLQAEESLLCFQCHNKKLKKDGHTIQDIERCVRSKYVHAPVADDGCSACHAAHTPDNYFLLSAAFPQGSYTEGKVENFSHCFDCHDSALMQEKETSTATNFRDGKINLHFVHVTREKARNCTTCHNSHGSKYQHLVAEKVPFGKWDMPMKFTVTATGGSCLTGCHKALDYNRNTTN